MKNLIQIVSGQAVLFRQLVLFTFVNTGVVPKADPARLSEGLCI